MSNDKKRHIHKTLSGHTIKNAVATFEDPKTNKGADTKLMLALLGMLIFVGMEAVKILFRKRIGIDGLALVRLILCSLIFGGIAFYVFNEIYSNWDFNYVESNLYVQFATGIVYTTLSIYILIKAIKERLYTLKNNIDTDDPGESFIAGFLSKDGWSLKMIQLVAEPILIIAIGIFLCLFDFIAGMPMIFCGLSVWGYLLMDLIIGDDSLHGTTDRLNNSNDEKDSVFEIK